MEWRFKKLTRNDTLQNPSHLEFFHHEALHSVVDALAREDIQNRLDARARNEHRVEVRYRLCGPVAPGARTKWFDGLARHLNSGEIKKELGNNPSLDRSLKWLVIEDFGTTGLQGDPLTFQDPDPNQRPRNDFFWFIRNVGRSGKTGADRGRWGLGKIVYPAASQIRSFFAYTVRQTDGARLLIGRSVLAVHKIGDDQYESEGYFGRFDNSDFTYFATPERTPVHLDEFATDFSLSRRTEPGLSLIIPWPDDDVTMDALVASVIEHWFWVILEDRLVVRVALDAVQEEVILSAATLEDVVRSQIGEATLIGSQLLRKLRFARDVHTFDETRKVHLSLCPGGTAPKWDAAEERFPSAEVLADLRRGYHAGELLGFVVPVRVRREDGTVDEESFFEVFLQRTNDGGVALETFLRDGLTISGQRVLREPGVLALIKAGDVANDALGSLLGDAENPAHTRWERSGKHFRGRYRHGPAILSFVQRAATQLCSLLSRRPEGVDKDLLQHLFSLPEPGAGRSIAIKPKSSGLQKIKKLVIKSSPPFLECTKMSGGFHIRPHVRAVKAPTAIQVRAAYEVVRGNPFRLHHPADFDLATLRGIDLQGLSVRESAANRLLLDVQRPDFSLTAIGFDPHRDLIVDVRPVHDGAAVENGEEEITGEELVSES